MSDTPSLTVLVVDDDPIIARLVADVLELSELEIRTHTARFEELLAPEPWDDVDVAIVDLMMPVVGGEEILAYLQSELPHVRRISLSASERALPEGLVDQRLVKPVKTADLLRAVRNE